MRCCGKNGREVGVARPGPRRPAPPRALPCPATAGISRRPLESGYGKNRLHDTRLLPKCTGMTQYGPLRQGRRSRPLRTP